MEGIKLRLVLARKIGLRRYHGYDTLDRPSRPTKPNETGFELFYEACISLTGEEVTKQI